MSDPTGLSINGILFHHEAHSILWTAGKFHLVAEDIWSCFLCWLFSPDPPRLPPTSASLPSAPGGWLVWWHQPQSILALLLVAGFSNGRHWQESDTQEERGWGINTPAPSLPRHSMLAAFLHQRPQLLPGSPLYTCSYSLGSGSWALPLFLQT